MSVAALQKPNPVPAVACSQIVKTYGHGDSRTPALSGANFQAAFGDVTLLTGPSGCGKTTLLCLMAGMLEPAIQDDWFAAWRLIRVSVNHPIRDFTACEF